MGRITLNDNYIQVVDSFDKRSFGGSQQWFTDISHYNVKNQGCGAISAVDVALYLMGKRRITVNEYILYVNSFLNESKFAKVFLKEFTLRKYDKRFAIGIIPAQISLYLNRRMKEWGKNIRFRWNGICGNVNMYGKLQRQLEMNIPVIWGLYSWRKRLRLYTFQNENEEFVYSGISVNSHYVTVTGIYESNAAQTRHKRMIEISSWGNKYYIDFDEYLEYIGNSLVSNYCSNILVANYIRK